MSFAPLRVDGGGLLQVIDIATSASAGVTAGTCIAGSDTQGFYLSPPATVGDAWTVQNNGAGAATFYRQCAAIMWSVRESNTIYAGVGNQGKNGGLLVSVNGGTSWALRSAVPQFAGNTAASPLPSQNWARSTGRLLVQDAGSNWLFAGTYAQGVLRDASNGTGNFPVACTMAGAAPGTNNWYCRSLVQGASPTTLYAAFYDSSGVTGAVWQCTNAHATTPNFTKMASSPATPEELVVLSNGDVVAACGANGLYLLPAGSATWSSLNGAGVDATGYWSAADGYIDASSNRVIFAACSKPATAAAQASKLVVPPTWPTSGTITLSNLAGTVQATTIPPSNYTWWNSATADAFGKSGFVNPFLRLDPTDATHQKIYVAGSQGLWRSVNGGTSWTIANSGLPQFLAHPVAADPNHNGHLVFGDSDWGLFDDAGPPGSETASTLVNDPPVKDTTHTPVQGVQGYSAAIDPGDSTVYGGVGRKYTNAVGEIYARTWNNPGGVGTWDGGGYTGLTSGALGFGASTAANGNVPIGLLALRDGSNAKILLAAAWAGGLWRWAPTGAGGAYAWTQVSTAISAAGQPGNCLPFAHVAGSAFVYCFDRNQGIFRSSDYGQTWTAAPIWAVTTATQQSGDIAAHPSHAGELWVTSGGSLYQLTGAQTATFTTVPAVGAVPNAGPVAFGASGTLYVATQDTGTGSGLLFSADGGATFHDAVGDSSFANCNSSPEHIAVGADGKVYVSGSNVVCWGTAAAAPGSAAFTEIQSSLNLAAPAGSGTVGLYFSQGGGAPSQPGSAVIARLECSDCSATITPPNSNWQLLADGKAGSASGQARAQIWAYLNNPGGLGAPPAVVTGTRITAHTIRAGRGKYIRLIRPVPVTTGSAGSPQLFTCSNSSATLKGKIHEYTTPAGTVQFADQAGTAGAVASATSLPVSCTGANTVTGGLGLALFAAILSGGTTGQSWGTPGGWTGDGNANNLTNVFNALYLAADASGTTSVTGSITLGTWTMTSWAAAAATLYAQAITPVTITTASLPNGAVGAAYSATVAASGGSAPYSFAQTGGTLPPGLSVSAAGAVSGAPTAAGAYTFTVTATDSAGQAASHAYTVTIAAVSTLAITTTSLPGGVPGAPYTATLTATGGTGGYTWAIFAGGAVAGAAGTPSPAPGLTLSAAGVISGTPTAPGTYTFTAAVTDQLPTTVTAVLSITITAVPSTSPDSMVIADQIELLGGPGGVPSAIPECAGAIFRLQPGYDLGEPQPTTDFVGSLILDGERPFGHRASNRTITLTIQIDCTSVAGDQFLTLAAALEVLLRAVDEQSWTLTWTRRGGFPLVLDCFRAQPAAVQWGGADQWLINPVGQVQLTFQALPYGRSDVPVSIQVASPLPGQATPPAPAVLDTFAAVSGAQWQQSTRCVIGPHSAQWNPCLPPLADCTGAGSQPGAFYQAALPAPVNITGLTALSVWAGFGSDYFPTWHKGPAVFVFTLTDGGGNTISFSRTLKVHASDESADPHWQLVTAVIPQGATFNYAAVTGYSITVTNRGYHTLRYTQLYLDALTANPPSQQKGPAPVRGTMYRLFGVQGTARTTCSAQFQLPPGTPGAQQTVILPGPVGTPQTWVCPLNVTSVTVENTGASGGAAVGGSGGGEYAAEPAVAVTPLASYTYTIGAGGTEASPGGPASGGGASVFTGDLVTVTANGGKAGTVTGAGGQGGTGSTNTTHHNGGTGGTGVKNSAGGGGGGSAGSTGAGGSASGPTGGAAGTGATPGAAGASGATSDRDGYPGQAPGGGAGGTLDPSDNRGGDGAPGQIKLTYTPAVAQFSTLIAHRPGPAAPEDLAPLVSPGPTDVPNGATEYPVPSLTPGVYADFNGTYTVAAVAGTWHSPSASRSVTVTVKQYEYAGGPAYSTSVTRSFTPATDTFIPGGATLAQVPIAIIGELTLPLKDVAPDNASGLYTVTITDSDTADTFLDILFLDTLGQTVMIGEAAPGAYANYYLDEPDPDRDLGRIMGSGFDRASAISVLDSALASGGPLYLEPGDNVLLVYAIEGAPALSVTYRARWFLDRLY